MKHMTKAKLWYGYYFLDIYGAFDTVDNELFQIT